MCNYCNKFHDKSTGCRIQDLLLVVTMLRGFLSTLENNMHLNLDDECAVSRVTWESIFGEV